MKGNVIASTNYKDNVQNTTSLAGKNYAFRPYFVAAMKGKKVMYPAVGVTTGKRGIYCSCPIIR